MGNYNSLPPEITSTNKNWDKSAKDNFNTALDRHTKGRDILQYLGNKLDSNTINGLFSRLNKTRDEYNNCHNRGAFCNRDSMNNAGNELERYVNNEVLITGANTIIDNYQTRVNTAAQNNAKFRNYSNVFRKMLIPQAEIDTAKTLIQNFKNARNRANASRATDVDNLIDKWNGLNNNNPYALDWLIKHAENAKKAADDKIANLESYSYVFQGTANILKNTHEYKNIDWYKNEYIKNPINESHNNLENTADDLNRATEHAGYRAPNDQGLLNRAAAAIKKADEKMKDLALYHNQSYFQDKINQIKKQPMYGFDYVADYKRNPTNTTHDNLESATNDLSKAADNAGSRFALQWLLDNADKAKKAADEKIANLELYGIFQGKANELKENYYYKGIGWFKSEYLHYLDGGTHINLENATNDLKKATENAGGRSAQQWLITHAENAKKAADEKIANLALYTRNYQGNIDTLKETHQYKNIEWYKNEYINNATNDTHHNLETTANDLNRANESAGIRSHDTNIRTNAINAINAADAKNATLDAYSWEYSDGNKYPRINVQRLRNALQSYDGYPANTTHDDLVGITNEVNNSNVSKMTPNPGFVTAAQSEINTAKTKNAQLLAYNKFYNNQIDYAPLEAELTTFQKNPSNNLHVQIFGDNGNYNKLAKVNRETNITPNADLITKANAAKQAAEGKIADLELYNKYGNYQDRANTLKGKDAGALGDFMIYYSQYNDNKTNETHQNLETKTNELNTSVKNFGGRSADQNLINAANTALGTADAKNKTLDGYVDYQDRNQFPRIDTGPLITARDAYNVNPNNTTHEALVNITNQINNSNVTQVTAHPHSLGLIDNEIKTAIQKNAQLVAYSDAYGNVAQNDYTPLEAQFVEFKAKPNTPLHDVIFGIGGNPKGNYDKVKEKNQSINITPSADLISKAREQIKEGNAKSQVYQQNPAYVNFVSTLTKPIKDCTDALTEYEKVQNNTTARNLQTAIDKLKTDLNNAPTITTPKLTPNADLLSKADVQLDGGDKLSKILQKNPAYVNFVSALTRSINDCTVAYNAYTDNPNDTTAKTLVDTTTTLQSAISGVPTITTPKPTPIQDLLSKAEVQLDGGDKLSKILQNNPAYASFATSLNKYVQDCQTAYDAYKDSPKESTAQILEDTIAILQTAISNVPRVTTSIATNTYVPTTSPIPGSTYDPTTSPIPGSTYVPTTSPIPGSTYDPTTSPIPGSTYVPTTSPIPGSTYDPTTSPIPGSTYDPTTTPIPGSTYDPTTTPIPGSTYDPNFTTNTNSTVTLNPNVNVILVNSVDSQIKSAESKIVEIRNNPLLATKEPFGSDLDTLVKNVKDKFEIYKVNPNPETTSALMQATSALTDTMKIIDSVPVTELISNRMLYGTILGSILSSTLTSSPYAPTSSQGTYAPTSSQGTYAPTSSPSTYAPTSSLAPGTTYGPATNIPSLAYNPMDSVPRPTFNYAISNPFTNNNISSCPTFNCAPYQTTVPPTTAPHKCQTCYSCRRCHKCHKHHKCHRKTPTNTNKR